ncbi:imidazolonepropionase [Candidatus Woesearchaeota archaeon]|nr:imidazolonepropionase [Candidatus Woesearchaeota archaeon]
MNPLILYNIKEVLTCKSKSPKIKGSLQDLGIIKNATIYIKDGKILDINKYDSFFKEKPPNAIDCSDYIALPGFIDCHTHLVFAGSREKEFVQKVKGKSYLEILASGGGILNTVESTRKASFSDLYSKARSTLEKMLSYGTTTVEAKTGYGLDIINELKCLYIMEFLRKDFDIVPTYLGAHTIPKEFKENKDYYIYNLIYSLLSIIKQNNLAEFCDVFCEENAFSLSESEYILLRAKELGLKLKIHAEQINYSGSAELAAKLGAVSADHLENISEKGIEALAGKKVIGVLLPAVNFHLMSNKYAPARLMVEKGVPIALASDYNPGSSPIFNMQLVMAMACRFLKLTPAEAINAATINAAFAIDKADEIGSIETDKKADIVLYEVPSYDYIPYSFGDNLAKIVIKNGKIIKSS